MEELTGKAGQINVFPLDPQTRASNYTPYWAVGEKVGLYVRTANTLDGPIPLTISRINGGIQFVEALPFVDKSSKHTFYAYHPYEINTSTNPERVKVAPIGALQVQKGNDSEEHVNPYKFNVAAPASIYPDENLNLYFTSTCSFFRFQIHSNVNGLVVNSIKVEAPTGKLINFTDAKINLTLPESDPNFARYFDLVGGSSATTLRIEEGGLPVPNATSDYAFGHLAFNPVNCSGQTLKITVSTEDGQVFTFEKSGLNYIHGQHYALTLYIEVNTPKPQPKNIRVLSLDDNYLCYGYSTAGSLGNYDNTKVWNSFFGAMELRGRDMRRLLQQHFGPGKTVETGVITFETTDVHDKLNKLTDSYLETFDIIFLNERSRPTAQTAQRVMNWLNRSQNRVLILSYDWKDPTITPTMAQNTLLGKTSTNYLMFRDQVRGVTPHWYNVKKGGSANVSIGNWGTYRTGMLVPFELNERTSYFWKDGPFKTNLTANSDIRHWIENELWGAAVVTDPNVIQLITYRDARKDQNKNTMHANGGGDGGMILGVDPVKRIVYMGDTEVFSAYNVPSYATDARLTEAYKNPNEINNYTKIVGNLWAWMINEVVQKN
ncbi:fimbrillin family protein [Parabacteroides sp. PF5-6]|uniref:fimbrillin family protein n=1 Tax=Parabacteroides sp. PF5-6 TaxID=1742403 RepID=UPI0024058DAA|nr:fimbrillin family protein [Parabacteroides sp. PF5-6]